ncbi:hypothetical protein PI124_g21728 [Phytophthora idaei]|nr:hypothetical protein PI125_g23637 [Phytophthora idaei]KAG3127934.1 hypothetical protein PI126_g21630 [Phytophthora idaei]KAG3233195.1 hypothetical protein PI124_g21728 [Phytophthora idaei]
MQLRQLATIPDLRGSRPAGAKTKRYLKHEDALAETANLNILRSLDMAYTAQVGNVFIISASSSAATGGALGPEEDLGVSVS